MGYIIYIYIGVITSPILTLTSRDIPVSWLPVWSENSSLRQQLPQEVIQKAQVEELLGGWSEHEKTILLYTYFDMSWRDMHINKYYLQQYIKYIYICLYII